ncbi:MAG: pyruvate:ferredoxin (flavodoxin) oxidoreductase [Tenericutes bacterium]|nr:pyruvate:ferredoxin (flavodoxin) oxidoreductase [Mycoplasmatota bacterium]
MEQKIMDGNSACSYVSYNFTEVAGIYPITPASTMAEKVDEYSASGKTNMFGDVVKVVEMQSEAGAIGMVHGLLQNGVLATTYTASQGLLLMIPNMYKIAGELLPCVINVAARTVATHALSIMGDHSDIYSTRPTGFAIFSSSSVQQVMDLTGVSYLSSIKGRIPFVNFFDGFRTSHEYNKINVIDNEIFKELLDYKALENFRKNSLDIDNPTTRGTNQGDMVYFEAVEARNKYYEKLPDIVNDYMEKINKKINTNYKPFNYYGDKNAKKVIVAMGSVCETVKEVIKEEKGLGLIEVHLYRPFSSKYFLNVLPKSVRKIAVLDRTKEAASNGEPLYLDVVEIIKKHNLKIEVVGGRYGLSSKNTTKNDIDAVYKYLDNKILKTFTIGINDDVNNISLTPTTRSFKNTSKEILIYGYGSDGMVTTSKNILTLIGEKTPSYVQGYFEYDSKKSGGVTKSHLRFSKEVINSPYYVTNPYMVVCSKDTYLKKYDVLNNIKENGIFLLNTEKDINNLNEVLPVEVINEIKEKKINFYIINANKIAYENNIPNKISMIMEMAILNLMGEVDMSLVKKEMKHLIKINFSKKGIDVVNSNINALSSSLTSLKKVDISLLTSKINMEKVNNTLYSKLEHARCDLIKVSDFNSNIDGVFEGGTSALEKRGLSNIIPSYDKDKCIMCNMCSLVCPHAVVRPYLLDKEEIEKSPLSVKEHLKDAKIKDNDLSFTIGISVPDCTGCSLCSMVCPTKAITLKKQNLEARQKEMERYNYLQTVSEKHVLPKTTIKGSQFVKPKFEFSGACAGCGETPYLKLLSQLFGDDLMIANATGCSSIYGASIPSMPYTVPWVNSLFEDNAEFGYGIRVGEDFMHEKVKRVFKEYKNKVNSKNKKLIDKYLKSYSKEVAEEVYNNLDYEDFKEIIPLKKYIKEKTIFIVGGDGWAYDIGYGGIDHVLANNENVNILVLDTEVYSNTGGQSSKSTRMGATAKFASSGKKTAKKDLAKMALNYKNVYVATVSLGANYMQTIKALTEAASYNGPSIIICYAPCIAHGIKSGMKSAIEEEKLVTESGYFPLFRYNPETEKFTLDSKADFTKYNEIFNRENRYSINEEEKISLLEQNKKNAIDRYNEYKTLEGKDEK